PGGEDEEFGDLLGRAYRNWANHRRARQHAGCCRATEARPGCPDGDDPENVTADGVTPNETAWAKLTSACSEGAASARSPAFWPWLYGAISDLHRWYANRYSLLTRFQR